MKTMLLVDDSRAIRLAGRRIVESLGIDVLEAGDGAEALQLCRAHGDIDAVLLDWNMPVMDGLTFLSALRSEKRPQPIVVMRPFFDATGLSPVFNSRKQPVP